MDDFRSNSSRNMHLNDVGDDEEEENSDKSSCERFAMKRLFLGYNVDGTGHE